MCYIQVSAGDEHTVLLRSDGHAVACGLESSGCEIPPLEEGMTYTRVSAGGKHAVLLRSDGHAVACGENEYGQCNIPHLSQGLSYIQVSASCFHTVLLQSDGQGPGAADPIEHSAGSFDLVEDAIYDV